MKNLRLIIATSLLAVGIASLIYWFTITAKDITFEAMKAEYNGAFPSFLQNSVLQALLFVVILGVAGILFFKVSKQGTLKIVARGGMILSFILAFWQLFSIM